MRDFYQLKITIMDIEMPIWRRLLVPKGITFNKFHKIIQAAFDWQDYHLFEFEFPDVRVTIPMDEMDEMDELDKPQLNAKNTRIDTLIDLHNEFLYIYDLGDYWQHHIELEKAHSSLKILTSQCVAGERHRPPEDVGGTGGYEDFLRIIGDPNHPEYDEMLQWAEKDTGGRKFDPEYFYLNEINRKLSKIK